MSSLVLALLLADTLRPGVAVKDEGTLQGRAQTVNCTGAGLLCSVSGGVWTLNAAGGGGSGLPADPAACTSGQYVIDQNASGVLACAQVQWGQVGGVPATFPATVPVATATALAANGTNCSAGSPALGVDASGNAEGCAQIKLNWLADPDGNRQFNMGSNAIRFFFDAPTAAPPTYEGAFNVEAQGGFSGDLLHVHQFTGNPGPGTDLVHLEFVDTDVTALHIIAPSSTDKAAAITGTVDVTGVVTASGFSGPLTGAVTGNASTASALAADGADCVGAGEFAKGVTAAGVASGCAVPSVTAHTLMGATHSDVDTAATSGGDLVVRNSGNTQWTHQATGTATQVLHGGTNVVAWGSVDLANDTAATALPVGKGGLGASVTPAAGTIIYGASATGHAVLAAGTAGQVLRSGGAGAPVWVGVQTCTSSASTTCTITVARSGCVPVCMNATAVSTWVRGSVSSTTLTCTFSTSGTNTCNCLCP